MSILASANRAHYNDKSTFDNFALSLGSKVVKDVCQVSPELLVQDFPPVLRDLLVPRQSRGISYLNQVFVSTNKDPPGGSHLIYILDIGVFVFDNAGVRHGGYIFESTTQLRHRSLFLDAVSGQDSPLEIVLYLAHLGHEVCFRDDLIGRVSSGEDHLDFGGPLLQEIQQVTFNTSKIM